MMAHAIGQASGDGPVPGSGPSFGGAAPFALMALGWGLALVLRWPLAVRGAALAVYLLLALAGLHVWCLGATTVAVAALMALGLTRIFRKVAAPAPVATGSVGWGGLLLATGWVLSRERFPVVWDEWVWLAKSRLEAEGFGALTKAALDRGKDVIPPGYPLLWSQAMAWASGMAKECTAWTAGGALVVLAMVVLYMYALADLVPRHWRSWAQRPLVFALGVPLAMLHLRLVYADAPLGLLAGTLVMVMMQALTKPTKPSSVGVGTAPVVAVVMTGMKDEGFAHVLAVCLVMLVFSMAYRQRLAAAVAVGTSVMAGLVFAAWRFEIHRHGVVDKDHTLGLPDWNRIPWVLDGLLHHGSDSFSWGIFWAVVSGVILGVLALLLRRRCPRRLLVVSCIFLAQAGVLLAGVVAGPPRVLAFAVGGTLLNRLLVQLVPTAMVLLTLAALDDDLMAPSENGRETPM